jgi:hypothetical protein
MWSLYGHILAVLRECDRLRSPKPGRRPQRKHTIAEGQLQIQPLAQSQTVVQLLKQTLGQGEADLKSKFEEYQYIILTGMFLLEEAICKKIQA